jgi:hypothetical protein
MVVLLMVSCKPTSTSHTKEISILSSLADANRRLSPIRAKFNSGRILSTSDVGTLMSIVASKPLIKASEREHLYSLLQQMRIPDAAHTMRTYLLGREFGEHAKDRKETIFEEAKKYLISTVINADTRSITLIFERGFKTLPPNPELRAVFELIPRVVERKTDLHPPYLFRPKNIGPYEYLALQKWWQMQPEAVQRVLGRANSETVIKLGVAVSAYHREGIRKSFVPVALEGEYLASSNNDITRFFGSKLYKIDAMIEKTNGRKPDLLLIEVVSFCFNRLSKDQKGKILGFAAANRQKDAWTALLNEINRKQHLRSLLNAYQAMYDINLRDGMQDPPKHTRYSSRLHLAVSRAAQARINAREDAIETSARGLAELSVLLNLHNDPNAAAIRKRVEQEWQSMNKGDAAEMVGVIVGFGKGAKGLFWDLPKGAAWDPLVNGDTQFYQGMKYVFTNPDVMASLLINSIDHAHLNQGEKIGGLIFETLLVVLTLPAGGSGGIAARGFKVLEKFDGLGLDKARKIVRKFDALALKAQSKLKNSSSISQSLQRKAQQLSDLASQARTKLRKLEIDQATKQLDELATAAEKTGNSSLVAELRRAAVALKGGNIADAAASLDKLRQNFGGRLPGNAEELLHASIKACRGISLSTRNDCIPGPNGAMISIHQDALTYGGKFKNKYFRVIARTKKVLSDRLHKFLNTKHGDKHRKATATMNDRKLAEISRTNAQYTYKLVRDSSHYELENLALVEGVHVQSGSTIFSLYRSPTPVGFNSGKATHWIRSEYTSGSVVHGHPRSLPQIRQAINKSELFRIEIAQKFGALLDVGERAALGLSDEFIAQCTVR